MSISVSDFGDYEVKGVKSFIGMEGYGFNATLYRKGKKVAFCIDSGDGGMVDIQWLVKSPKNREEYPSEEAYKAAWERYHAAVKVEQDLLDAHLKTLEPVPCEWGDKKPLKIDEGWFVADCVTKWEREKDIRKMQRQCKTKTLYRTKDSNQGAYMIIAHVFDDKVRDHLRNKHGADVEIFNDVLANGGIPSVLQA